MSGGRFDYSQYQINDISSEIENIIKNNNIKNEFGYSTDYSEETLKEFKSAVMKLREAAVYAQRVDWLVSGDDGEESFHEQLKQELEELCRK